MKKPAHPSSDEIKVALIEQIKSIQRLLLDRRGLPDGSGRLASITRRRTKGDRLTLSTEHGDLTVTVTHSPRR